jgi:hypothetical protein
MLLGQLPLLRQMSRSYLFDEDQLLLTREWVCYASP